MYSFGHLERKLCGYTHSTTRLLWEDIGCVTLCTRNQRAVTNPCSGEQGSSRYHLMAEEVCGGVIGTGKRKEDIPGALRNHLILSYPSFLRVNG